MTAWSQKALATLAILLVLSEIEWLERRKMAHPGFISAGHELASFSNPHLHVDFDLAVTMGEILTAVLLAFVGAGDVPHRPRARIERHVQVGAMD